MWQWLWGKLLARLFGEGLGADIAGRGAVYLADEARKAIDRDEIRLTTARLRPGETYTVVARPPATRSERRLARRQAVLRERDRHLSRPSRRQLAAARRLARAQRRLDRRREGTRRYERARRAEADAGERFDRVMTPSRRQRAVHAELQDVSTRLEAERATSFEAARRALGGPRRRRGRAQVFD